MLSHDGGELVSTEELAARILKVEGIEGVSVSGGEPLLQTDGLYNLLARVRDGGLSTLVFTGFTRDMIMRDGNLSPLMALCDIVVAGPYVGDEHHGHGLLGSLNQEVLLLTDRYTAGDIESVPEAEIDILEDGTVVVSGTGVEDLNLEESLGRVVKNPLLKR
jgi:anaerobic ribonucleoside-triphosphate reductase activating protein